MHTALNVFVTSREIESDDVRFTADVGKYDEVWGQFLLLIPQASVVY